MNYKMEVIIVDPDTAPGMTSDLFFSLDCSFEYVKGYGNGHYLSISGTGFSRQIFDLRYDRTFDCNNKERWLEAWAKSYWSGVNGAYAIKSLVISRV